MTHPEYHRGFEEGAYQMAQRFEEGAYQMAQRYKEEVERLRAERDHYRNDFHEQLNEVERLRAALDIMR